MIPAALAIASAFLLSQVPSAADLAPSNGLPHVAVAALLAQPGALVAWLQEHNGDVRAAAERVWQARADVGTARLVPNPVLNLSAADLPLGATNPLGLGAGQTAIYAGSLQQTVEIAKRGPRTASAQARLTGADESYFDALDESAAAAREAIGRLVHLQQRQAALEDDLSAARQILDLQKARLDNGDLAGNDYDRLVVDTQMLEGDVVQNRAEYASARAACRAVLLAECDVEAAEAGLLSAAVEVPEPAGPADTGLDHRPDIAALEAAESASHLDALLARRRSVPDANLILAYTRDYLTISGDQPRTLQFGVGLTLPLFDHGQHDAARAEARAREIHAGAEALRERARGDVEALRQRRHDLEQVLSDVRSVALPRARTVLDSTLTAVNHGELSMTDLLLARRTQTEVALKAMDLEFAAFETRSQLRQALGLDGELARHAGGTP